MFMIGVRHWVGSASDMEHYVDFDVCALTAAAFYAGTLSLNIAFGHTPTLLQRFTVTLFETRLTMQCISISQQLKYDHWANHRLLDAVTQLDAEKYVRGMGSSFPSIRDTLVHMAWAEWLWLERWQGHSPREHLNSADFPTLESIRNYWSAIEKRQMEFLGALREGSEQKGVRYANFQGIEWEYSLGEMIHHLVTHSTYHRGQVATMLRQFGIVPPQTDYLVFVDSQNNPSPSSAG
jgi:uncharacterized damage-inducible protein DinB